MSFFVDSAGQGPLRPSGFQCSGRQSRPCAKVFAFSKNACTPHLRRRHLPAPLLLLSNCDPLRWARSWGHPAGASFSFPEISVFIVPSTSGQSPLCSDVFFSPNKSAVRLRPNVSCESYNRRLPGKNGPCNANGLLEEIFQLAIKRFFFHMLPVVFLRLPAAHRLVKSLRLYGGMTGEVQPLRALIFGPICREGK